MSSHPITSVPFYTAIFGALIALTGLTVVAAWQDFGFLNTPIALGIAGLKASLVVIFFMGVRYNTPLTRVVVVGGFAWLIILFTLTLNDYLTRDWLGVAGR